MLDHSPITKTQIGSLFGLDHSPASNELRHYLIACKVEGKSPATIDSYCQRVGAFIEFAPFLGERVDVNTVRTFLLSLQQRGLAPSTVNVYYRALKTYFNWLAAEGIISKSPMQNIKPPRVPRQIVKPFSQQDIENLLLLCSGNKFLEVRNRSIILLFMDTGLRLSELAGIQLKDIDFDREIIKVMGKGAKERVVRIGKKTQKALLRYLLMRTDTYPCLWVSEERRPITAWGIQLMIRKLGKRAGFTNVRCSPHTFRHTFGTASLLFGAGIREVQTLLGHSTLEMTMRYVATVNSENAIEGHRGSKERKGFSPVENLLK